MVRFAKKIINLNICYCCNLFFFFFCLYISNRFHFYWLFVPKNHLQNVGFNLNRRRQTRNYPLGLCIDPYTHTHTLQKWNYIQAFLALFRVDLFRDFSWFLEGFEALWVVGFSSWIRHSRHLHQHSSWLFPFQSF